MGANHPRCLQRASLLVIALGILSGPLAGVWAQAAFSVDTTFTRKMEPASRSQASDLKFTTSSARTARTDKVNQFISDLSVSAHEYGRGFFVFQAFPSLAILIDENRGAMSNFDQSSAGDVNWLSSHLDTVAVVHESFDVITVPTRCSNALDPLCMVAGRFSTQVQPEDGGNTPVSTFILER